jgi:hypothetical protein
LKYWPLFLILLGAPAHSGELEDCFAIPGGAAWVGSCVHSLALKEKKNYEQAFSDFLKSKHHQPDALHNPKEFIQAINEAKTAWDSATEADCRAKGLRNIKDSFSDHTDKSACLYSAYSQRIQYYKDYDNN